MNGKSMVLMFLAVVCGLGAMYGTNRMLARKGPAPVEMQEVLVAGRDIKVEEVLKADMVKVVSMPKSGVPAGSFKELKDAAERCVNIPILAGEPIVEAKLAPKGTPPGLVARIPKGMRAFAVEVNEQTGVSGFILPGHRVDVVQTRTGASAGGEQSGAELVLQDVQVLASGQIFTRPDDRSIPARTVTLAVTPEQVEILVAARMKGALSLSLRGVNDREVVVRPEKPEPRPVVLAARPVEPAPAPAPPPPPPPPPAPEPRPRARYLLIHHGLMGLERVRIGDRSVPDDDADEDEEKPASDRRPSLPGLTGLPSSAGPAFGPAANRPATIPRLTGAGPSAMPLGLAAPGP